MLWTSFSKQLYRPIFCDCQYYYISLECEILVRLRSVFEFLEYGFIQNPHKLKLNDQY